MVIVDVLLVVVFALLAVYYGMRVSHQRAQGDPKVRWSVAASVLSGLAAVGWAAALIVQVA